MQALQTTSATQARASAINNAVSQIEIDSNVNAETNLKISNLEKQIKRNTQSTNEFINKLKQKT